MLNRTGPTDAARAELAWLVIWVICVAVIVAMPAWRVVPLDVMWISLALLYGFRIWPSRRLLAFTSAAITTTGGTLLADSVWHVRVVGDSGGQIPVLAIMVVAMAWQAHRWVAADDRAKSAAQENAESLAVAIVTLEALLMAEVAARGCGPGQSSATLTTSPRRAPRQQNGSA